LHDRWLTCRIVTEDDPPEEECQEGYPVLPDGLRCLWNWYVLSQVAQDFAMQLIAQATANVLGTGRTTFVNTLCSKGVLQHKDADDAGDAHVEDGVKIKPITVGTYIHDDDQFRVNI
jgi:hypothetical protein